MQIFASSPQRWSPAKHTSVDVACFLQERLKAGVDPIFLHTIYLVNLASASDTLRKRSIGSLVSYLDWASQLDAAGVVTHLGSGGQQLPEEAERLVERSLAEVLASNGTDVPLCIETSAGAGGTIGASFSQIGRIIRGVADAGRLGLCIDTAHVYAAGYDLTTADGLERMLEDVDRHVGIERLRLVHANDSKTPLGSHVDRHENIGHGHIGERAFRRLLHHPAMRDIPFIIEVPGFDRQGPDAENIALLRQLAQAKGLDNGIG